MNKKGASEDPVETQWRL